MAKDVKSNQAVKDEQKLQKQARRHEAKKKADKQTRKNTIVFVCIIAILIAFAVLVIFNKCSTSGSTERNTVVASTDNFEVTQAMMTYYFNTAYNQYANYFGSNTDTLKTIVDSVNERGSWYDSFMSSAKTSAEQYLTVAEMAKAAGVSLDKDDMAEIDDTIKYYEELKKSYANSGNSAYSLMTFDRFLESMFGDSVNESVVRECLKLAKLTSKYQEEYVEALEYTDEQLEEYYSENKDNYFYVDVLKYAFTEPKEEADTDTDTDTDTEADTAADTETDTEADVEADVETDEETDEEIDEEANEETDEEVDAEVDTEAETESEEETVTEARKNAEELAATKSVKAFNDYMTAYFTAEAEKTLEEGKEVDADEIKSKVDALTKTKQLVGNISEEEAKEWAFAADTKVGDTKLIVDEEKGTYTVYMLAKAGYRDEEITKNAAVLYLTDDNNGGDSETKANEIMTEWNAGEKTEEAFIALCEKYSESAHNHVEEGYTKSTTDIGEWLYADGRAVGDVGVVHSDANKCSYLVYFAGDGPESWKVSVKSAKQNVDWNAAMDAFVEEHNIAEEEKTPTIVKFDEAAIKKVKPISLSVNA